jgi:hypothetical protein
LGKKALFYILWHKCDKLKLMLRYDV